MSISPNPAVVLSLLTAFLGTVLYHLTQKQIPADANPAATLTAVYLIGALFTAVLLLIAFRPTDLMQTTRLVLNWNTVALGLAVVLIEVGFLWMYRSGWQISLGALAVNILATIALITIGVIFFGERLSTINWIGITVCIVGMVLLNYRAAG
jgi:drug/metabolite transporter (DMT)-like permease